MDESWQPTRLLALVATLLLVVMSTFPAAAQTVAEAVAAYERGEYATAFTGFRLHAEQGAAAAQFNLGLMYYEGRGAPQDYAEAVRWYRRAAEQGDADAQFNLGHMYTVGKGVSPDIAEAVRWFRHAANHRQRPGVTPVPI